MLDIHEYDQTFSAQVWEGVFTAVFKLHIFWEIILAAIRCVCKTSDASQRGWKTSWIEVPSRDPNYMQKKLIFDIQWHLILFVLSRHSWQDEIKSLATLLLIPHLWNLGAAVQTFLKSSKDLKQLELWNIHVFKAKTSNCLHVTHSGAKVKFLYSSFLP